MHRSSARSRSLGMTAQQAQGADEYVGVARQPGVFEQASGTATAPNAAKTARPGPPGSVSLLFNLMAPVLRVRNVRTR
jgi:hypothetical protein